MPVKPDLSKVTLFIKSALPEIDSVLKFMESKDGWLPTPEVVVTWLKKLKIANWPEFYVDEGKLRALQLNFFIPLDEQKEFIEGLKKAGEQVEANWVNNMLDEVSEEGALDFESLTDEELESAKKEFLALDEETKANEIKKMQLYCVGFITTFLNYLSLMVHGYKLTTLVRKAMEGNDLAFLMAVQIDRTILTSLPYFRERYWRAAIEGNSDFLELLSYRLKNPPIRGRIRYRTLWLLFAMLDDMMLLGKDVTNEMILNIYKGIPEEHVCKPINDVEYVRKQRHEYLKLKRQTKLF